MDGPFPLAVTDRAFDDETLAQLYALFDGDQAWVRHQDTFYRCFIAEVDGQLPERLLDDLRDEVAAALGLDLAGRVRVTAQRMAPTDGSDRHTDRPLAGYEAARLVVQLDSAVGGHFRAFDGERVWLDRPPQPNQALAFELCRASHHDVTACTGVRRTVVFHFWHVANPMGAREALDSLVGAMSFADLPAALHPVMDEAEATCPDDLTHRAASVATLLWRWGLDEEGLIEAYRAVIAARPLGPPAALADFLIGMHVEGFDRQAWERIHARRL